MSRRVAVVGLAIGCATATPEPAPPAPAPQAPEPPDEAVRPIHANPPSPRTVTYTPRDAQGRPVFLNADGTCFVFLPPKGKARPTEGVACPPELADPAWKACAPGEIRRSYVHGDDLGCLCFPQPPGEPQPVACPAHDPTDRG